MRGGGGGGLGGVVLVHSNKNGWNAVQCGFGC